MRRKGLVPVRRHAVLDLVVIFAVGQDPADVQVVEAHAVVAVRVGEVARERLQAALREAVVEQVRLPTVRVDRADVEHAALGFFEMRQRRLNQENRRTQVDRHHALEERNRRRLQVRARDDRGVVHDPVDAAKRLHRRGDDLRRTRRVHEIGDAERGALGAELLDERLAVGALDAVHQHARTLGDAAFRDGLADTARAAGDDDDFVFQPHF